MGVTIKDFKPTKDQVVVLVPKIQEKTKDGIFKGEAELIREAKEMSQFFEVVSIGKDVLEVSVGHYVHVNMNRCLKLPIVDSLDEDYQVGVCREYDIYGVSNVR